MDMNSGLLPRQLRRIDAAPEKPWRVLQVEKCVPDAVFQFVDVRRRRVSEPLLGLGPNLLVRIELRSVGGKMLQMKSSAAMQIPTHGFVPMDWCTCTSRVPAHTSPRRWRSSRRRNSTTRSPLMLSRWHRKYMPIHWRAEEIVIAEMTETRSCR